MSGTDSIQTQVIRSCPICGGQGRRLYEGLRDHAHSIGDQWHIDQCTSCSGLWLNPQPIIDERPRCYPQGYYTHGTHETEIQEQATGLPLLRRAERSLKEKIKRGFVISRLGYRPDIGVFWRLCGQIVATVPPLRNNAGASVMFLQNGDGKLVDVGCGDGQFLKWMKSLGWDVAGIEPDPVAARRAMKRLDASIICDTLEAADVPAGSFDVATMGHVIEHVDRPADALRKIYLMLKPGGHLAITTPNVNSLGHRAFKRSWRHLDPPRHLLMFSMSSLCETVRKAGFEITFQCTVTRTAWWVAAQSAKNDGRVPLPPAETQTPTWPSRVFAVIEAAATMLLSTVGEELLVVAKKPVTRAPASL